MKDKIKLPYGLKENRLFHISEVESGLNCNCICPKCGSELIARKGPKNIHHFAHHRETNCIGGLETAIHLMAKQIIYDKRTIATPEYRREVYLKDSKGKIVDGGSVTIPQKVLQFDKVDLEITEYGYKPDVIASLNGKKLYIEIKVTHAVDNLKIEHIKSLRHPMIEIDLSDMQDLALKKHLKFQNEVLFNTENRVWVFNPKGEDLYKECLEKLKAKVDRINKQYILQDKRREEKNKRLREIENRRRKEINVKRESLRKSHSQLISQINQSYTSEWEKQRKQVLLEQNKYEISIIKSEIDKHWRESPALFNGNILYGWFFEAHPIVWQGAIFLKYIQNKPVGTILEPKKIVKFLEKKFKPNDLVIQFNKLSKNQDKPSRKYLMPHQISGIWFLEKHENARFITAEKPVIEYLNYLLKLRILTHPKFKIRFNSSTAVEEYQKEVKNQKRAYEERINRELKAYNSTKKMRVEEIIKSEKRVYDLYGEIGRQCKNCMLASHSKDGNKCLFCGSNDFKQIRITDEHLNVAFHKYQCNSSVSKALSVNLDNKHLLNDYSLNK